MNKSALVLAGSMLVSLMSSPTNAAPLFAWNDHVPPFTFRFDNEIDTHQLSKLTGDGSLIGFLYIQFVGTTTKDGYRVASHGDCSTVDCTVGWAFNATPRAATLLVHEMGDHPLYFIERADIPQPGAFSHFHWLGAEPAPGAAAAGYVLQLIAAKRFCFIHHGAAGATNSKTCRANGGVAVEIGADTASHLNIVAVPLPAAM
jgi:hypothetical protein